MAAIKGNGGMNEYALFCDLCRFSGKYFSYLGEKGKRLYEDKELVKALDLLEMKVSPREVHSLSFAAALLSLAATVFVLAASCIIDSSFALLSLIFLVFPLVIYLYIEKYPTMMLEAKKTEMLGHIPAIASCLVISLRISPILEKAVEFSSEHTSGLPRKLLSRMVNEIHMGKSTNIIESLSRFADEWGNIPEFKAFIQLLIASTLESSEKGRWNMLDNGMNVLLSGLRERTDQSARQLETPILVVFTFLVILPLVFIGLVPILPTIGMDFSPLVIFFLYDVVLPAILFIAISFIVSSKPITIPPIEIPKVEYSSIFGIKANRNNKQIFFLAVFFLAAALFVPGVLNLADAVNDVEPSYPLGTSLILLGVSIGVGIYLIGTSYSVKKMRDDIKNEEEEFSETLRQLSVLLSSGRPLPNAMAHITDINKGRTAQIFSKAANNIRLFNINMHQAFFAEKGGSAAKTYSGMIRSSIETIISMSGRSGKSIASVIIRLSEHIRNMRTVDLEMKKIISNVTASMIIIAVFVGPLVGGVATSLGYLLAKTLGGSDASELGFGGLIVKTLNPEIIKLIIGIYVLETTAILSVFSDDLIYGRDSVIKKYHLGMYLPIAAVIFSFTVLFMQEVFMGMM
jgi:Flp pilus assembly protein TadB